MGRSRMNFQQGGLEESGKKNQMPLFTARARGCHRPRGLHEDRTGLSEAQETARMGHREPRVCCSPTRSLWHLQHRTGTHSSLSSPRAGRELPAPVQGRESCPWDQPQEAGSSREGLIMLSPVTSTPQGHLLVFLTAQFSSGG